MRNSLPTSVLSVEKQFSFYSTGFFNRIFIGLQAKLNQGDINHITGDVHFVALFLKKRQTILTIHDIGAMQRLKPFARWIFKWLWIILPVRRSAVVTTISEATKCDLLKYVKVGPEKIKVIYNPIPIGFQKAIKGFNKAKPVILQLGTKDNKNIPRLIKALQGIPCFLEIIGIVNEQIENELRDSGVEFKNYTNLTDGEIVERYRRADVVTLVSTLEGFGLPILEANATGRVVVTSNISSMPEVAGNAAHLVDPLNVLSIREGILRVIDDDHYREKLIANGFENCKRFDISAITKQYLDIYTDVYNHTINR
jgi:glycosyltransferase involved in cell wall biosynthesis